MVKESKRVVNFKPRHVEPSEEIVATAEGYIGKATGSGKDSLQNGAMIITSTRAVFYRKGWLGEILETMPSKGVTTVERKSLLGHRVNRLHTSHDCPEFKTSDRDDEAALAKATDADRQAAGAPRDIATSPEASNPVGRLKLLAGLKEAGLVTDDEYGAKGAEFVGQLQLKGQHVMTFR